MHKKTFSRIILILVIILMLLPFITTFNGFLTSIFLKVGWYKVIESWLLPFETRTIALFINFFGYKAVAAPATISILRNGVWQRIMISWNCIGWQSLIVFLLTLLTGLQGKYSAFSKFLVVAIGFLGTFIVNILRVSIISIMIVLVNKIPATILHDYFSTFILIFWLFFFWWFSYSFVLVDKEPIQR